LRATKECVPALELEAKAVGVGLTRVPAELMAPPLVAECSENLECRVGDGRFVSRYSMFVLELKASIDPAQKNPKTIHHHGYGKFAVDGEMIKLKSRTR